MICNNHHKKCIYTNLVGWCSLDAHNNKAKHTDQQCSRGETLTKAKTLKEFREMQEATNDYRIKNEKVLPI